jgi:hypothetical protein
LAIFFDCGWALFGNRAAESGGQGDSVWERGGGRERDVYYRERRRGERDGSLPVTLAIDDDWDVWCLLFVLIRQGLMGRSGPQRLIRALGEETGNPIMAFHRPSLFGAWCLVLTFCINSTRGRGGHESPRWIRALGKGDGRTNRDLWIPPKNTVFAWR